MKPNALLLYLGTALALTGCSTKHSSKDPEAKKLEGTWNLVYQQINGKKLPDEEMAKMFHGKMVFTGNRIRYTVELPGFDFEFAYKLDPEERPKQIDLTLLNSPDKKGIGQKALGIYQFDGDRLVICHSKIKRPSDFEAGDGSHKQLILLKRASYTRE